MKTNKIRKLFLNYFKERGHQIAPSSSLVPGNDPTLLFTNAGMVQFKDVFLGLDKRPYTRATTVQRCVRAGGKHNDLENVGFTARHHTFFEMLGNFSFGDYFKREAIQFAWECLTQVFKLPKEKLWVTVYKDDDDAADIWIKEIGITKNRVIRLDENFWSMGDTGPCGPCSEIFYDHGEEIPGGPPGSPDEDGDRYIEVWNLVFMQFNRDAEGNMTPLPNPSIDTGMGLERIAAILQGVHNNYEIDLFQDLIQAILKITKTIDNQSPSVRVIADHIRSAAFLIADSVYPSNEGRGYVLRRIIRRALRHGNKLGVQEPFFYKLVTPLVELMGEAYPILMDRKVIIEDTLLLEEELFAKTLDHGLKILEDYLEQYPKLKTIPGNMVFKLYDTYGFPTDLTAVIAKEHGLSIDEAGFEREMNEQRKRSQEASHFDVDYNELFSTQQPTEFMGYEDISGNGSIVALLKDNTPTKKLEAGDKGIVVLDRTSFYAESGGQVGDTGILEFPTAKFVVEDTQKIGSTYLHYGYLEKGGIQLGDLVKTAINERRRKAIAANHSATHLLHGALRRILGKHVEQKGSLVAPDRLRFDFSHMRPVSPEELSAIETMVNAQIRANDLVKTEIMSPEEAKSKGAMALFGEKYGEKARVLCMGDFSIELCGGTHVNRTGDIGLFKIVSETGVAAGIRRIEAVTAQGALDFINQKFELLNQAAFLLKTDESRLLERLQQILDEQFQLRGELGQLKAKLTQNQADALLSHVKKIQDVHILTAELSGIEIKNMRTMVDQFKNKLKKAVVVLAGVDEENIHLVAGITQNLTKQLHAGELVKMIAEQIGGKGGGRPDMAQGGGNNPKVLPKALAEVENWVKKHRD
ncbi:MAG: alanine--tRNA ligase [Gammaproteobacteria bacterium]|nr:alanine--tRNA ligase [Gammaproteobacteria bacterium]